MAIPSLVSGEPLRLMDARVDARQTNAQGHLRAAEYVRIFDDAVMVFFPLTGLADPDLRHGETSPFLTDMHTCYMAELRAGDGVEITIHHLDHDARRARLIMSMTAATRLAATTELLIVNMGLTTRKPAPWSADQLILWSELQRAHAGLPIPPQAGRSIGPFAAERAR